MHRDVRSKMRENGHNSTPLVVDISYILKIKVLKYYKLRLINKELN